MSEVRAAVFSEHREHLIRVAYRMLGSVAEAEDIVQDAFLRWQQVDDVVTEPRAYLSRIVARLGLDRLKSAQHRREHYVGTWLPEPLVEDVSAQRVAEDVSVALMLTLERLSPLERAAFLLHDVFDMDFAEVATVLERTEPAVRQLAARGREHVRSERPRFSASVEAESRLAAAFATAMVTGDVDLLASILAADAVLYSDGGGKRRAALNPIAGADKILRFLNGVRAKRGEPAPDSVRPARINGHLGLVLHSEDGPETFTLETNGDTIVAIYIVRNPDKLRHIH